MKKRLLPIVLIAVLLSGCGGISQEEYDKVVAERDKLQQQVNEQAEKLSEIEGRMSKLEIAFLNQNVDTQADSKSDETAVNDQQEERASENDTEPQPEARTEEDNPTEDIKILKEYTLYSDFLGGYCTHFLIVQNTTNRTVNIHCSSLAYDADNSIVGTDDTETSGIGAGCTTILMETIETDKQIDHFETKIKTADSNFDSVLQDLSYEVTDLGNGAVVQVTNSGDDDASFVQGYCLFLHNGELIGYSSEYFTDTGLAVPSGETLSKQFSCSVAYDTIEFYMTGYGELHW